MDERVKRIRRFLFAYETKQQYMASISQVMLRCTQDEKTCKLTVTFESGIGPDSKIISDFPVEKLRNMLQSYAADIDESLNVMDAAIDRMDGEVEQEEMMI